MQNDFNLLGYAVFSSKPMNDWRNARYIPMKTPKFSHVTFVLVGEPGEDICFIPVLAALKEKSPRVVIWIYTDSVGEQIFRDSPYVDKVEVVPFDKWRTMLWDQAQREMRHWVHVHKHGVGWICNLSNDPASAVLTRMLNPNKSFGLLMDEDGKPIIVGNRWMQYAVEVMYPTISDELLSHENVMNKKYMFSWALGCNIPKGNGNLFLAPPDISNPLIAAGDVFLSLCPYAKYNSRRWPDEYWRKLCELIHEKYKIKILLLNPYKEDLSAITDGLDFVIRLDGLNLKEIAYYISRSRTFVSANNGFTYLSGALNIPTFVICGQSSKGPGFSGIHMSIRKDIPCGPCFLESCPRRYCLYSLSPEDVFSVFESHWELVSKGIDRGLSDNVIKKLRGYIDEGLILEIYDDTLPDIMYKYTKLSVDYTEDIITKISNVAFLYVWDKSNELVETRQRNFDFSQYIDWALSRDVDWNRFNDAISMEIKGLKEIEQKLGLLVLRLKDFFPRFWFFNKKSTAVDPDNLWDSLISFDRTIPPLIKKLSFDRVVDDPSPKAMENIKLWVEEKKQLLSLIRKYEEFLEQFTFNKRQESSNTGIN